MHLNLNEAHVWVYNINPVDVDFQQYIHLLNCKELSRAHSYLSDTLMQKFVITRAYLKKILAEYLYTNPTEIEFENTFYGKPHIKRNLNKSNLYFNLSHSNNVAVCIVSNVSKSGIDIEHVKPINDMLSIAKNFFSKDEYFKLLISEPADIEQNFYKIWTRKEAFIKAVGHGLSIPLDTFTVSFLKNEIPSIKSIKLNNEKQEKWYLSSFNVANDYIGAIAINKNITWNLKWIKHDL